MIEVECIEQIDEKRTMTSNIINSFLDKLEESIKKNKDLINKANRFDLSYNKKQIKLQELENIIQSYRNDGFIAEQDNSRKIIIYKGDPYLTLHICIQAYIQNIKIAVMNSNFMNGVNAIIFGIFRKLLEDDNTGILIDNFKEISIMNFEKIKKYYDETIVIGDSCTYQILAKNENNVKFYPYNNIAMYCENEKLEQLSDAIYIYSNENQYEIEKIINNNIDEVIEIINNDQFKSTAVLITENEENKEKFLKEIKNREIFINENPFKKDFKTIYNYLK